MRDTAGYIQPKYVEEEIEDEDDLESDDDENLGEDLSVTTKSPTPSPLGSPAGLSSSYLSQEPNEFPMPKTPVKGGLPTADGTLFSAEPPEHDPMVPKRRRIESPSSSEAANTQNGQSAGFSSPNRSPVPAGSSKTNGNAYPVLSALLNKTSFPAKCAKPTRNPMTSVPPTPELIAFAARWSETHAKISRISLLMGSGFRAGHEFAARFAEIQSHLAQASLLMRGSLPDDLKPPIPAAGLSNPAGSHQRQFQSTIAGSIQSSVPAGSPAKNKDQITFGPWIPVSAISCSAGSHQGQSQLATTDTSMESYVPSGQKQADGLFTAVGSSDDDGKSFPASLSNPNKLLPFLGPPKISFCKDFKQSIEEIEADRRMARLVPKGSKKPNGDSVAPNLDGLLEELSQLDPVAIESSVRATPELVNDHVNAVESPISVESLSPTASFDQNGLPMAVRSLTGTEASSPADFFEEGEPFPLATVAFPIQSSVQNGSEQANGLATVVESPNATGNGSPAASSDHNVLLMTVESPITVGSSSLTTSSDQTGLPMAVRSPTRTEASFPTESFEEATVGSPIQSYVRNGSEQANGLAIVVESPNATGNGSPAASSEKNGLSIGSPHQTETSSPAGSLEEATVASPIQSSVQIGSEQANGLANVVESSNTVGNGSVAASSDQNGLSTGSPHQTETSSPAAFLEDGSDKSNGNPVALEPLTPATNMSDSPGSRKRPAQQATLNSGSAKPNKLPNSNDAGSTEPNKLPTTAGSKFHPFQAFWEGLQSVDWKEVHSCLSGILSLTVDFPNGPVPLGSLLPDVFTSIVNSQPSPGSAAGPSAETSSASLPEPQLEENGSESNDVKMEDEEN
ncbi:unnamed protein product [Caenorhabditis nigoni]